MVIAKGDDSIKVLKKFNDKFQWLDSIIANKPANLSSMYFEAKSESVTISSSNCTAGKTPLVKLRYQIGF